MKKYFVIFLSILTFQFSCKKDLDIKTPQADFSVGGQSGGFTITYTDTSFIIGTHDALILMNQSTNADSVAWNFDNGKKSNSNNPLLTYDNPGNYSVSLTAYGKNGIKSVVSKKIKVMERILKTFSINNLDLNRFAPSQSGLPIFSKLNIWLEIKFSQSTTDALTSNGDILAPVVYKSPIFANIDSSFHSSLTFTLPTINKVIINSPVNNYDYTSKGRGVIVNLYGQDNSGTYLLASSAWSGTGLQILNGGNPASSKHFGLQTFVAGSPTNIKLDCEYQ